MLTLLRVRKGWDGGAGREGRKGDDEGSGSEREGRRRASSTSYRKGRDLRRERMR